MSEPPFPNTLAIRPFKPVACYLAHLDELHVYLRDCGTVEHWDKSGITLLKDYEGTDIVGLRIERFSCLATWDLCDAVMEKHFPGWFRFLYGLIRDRRNRKLRREMKAAGFPFA